LACTGHASLKHRSHPPAAPSLQLAALSLARTALPACQTPLFYRSKYEYQSYQTRPSLIGVDSRSLNHTCRRQESNVITTDPILAIPFYTLRFVRRTEVSTSSLVRSATHPSGTWYPSLAGLARWYWPSHIAESESQPWGKRGREKAKFSNRRI
jgi:hypothetical protein